MILTVLEFHYIYIYSSVMSKIIISNSCHLVCIEVGKVQLQWPCDQGPVQVYYVHLPAFQHIFDLIILLVEMTSISDE